MSVETLNTLNTFNTQGVLNTVNNITIVNVSPHQSPLPSPKKKCINPIMATVSNITKNKNVKNVTLKVDIEFPKDVNIDHIEDRSFNIMELSDFYDLIFAYNTVNKRGLYQNIKDKKYRWIFFSDEYETYDKEESKDLHMESVFEQKWYVNKFMTVYTLDDNLKYGKYILPATKQEYDEDKELYQKLYQIMRKNDSIIGKNIKTKKM